MSNNSVARGYIFATLLAALAFCAGCGSGSSSSNNNNNPAPPGSNSIPITVNAGPVAGTAQTNIGYVTVTVCVPGTSMCQTIPDIQADTGSEGLRVVSGVLNLSLPQENDGNGNPIGECAQFADGYTWGPVMMADVQMGGETASNIPIEVIGGPNVGSAPSGCTSTGLTGEQTVAALGANGLVGIGPFRQDCGGGCTTTGSSNPGFYFSCPSSGCSMATASLAQQLQNPVSAFANDNNGTIIELPAISSAGAATVTGSLVFGIGTQSNNSLGNATVFPLDNSGNFTTTFKNTPYSMSFIDSGSNGIFFLDSTTTGLPNCAKPEQSFYCPASTANLSATNSASNGASNTVNFSIANASSLNGAFTAFNDLGGSNPNTFDWGLPFFYGRNVFTGIEGQNSPAGVGPFFAY